MSNLQSKLREISKYASIISDKTLDTLNKLNISNESIKIQFSESTHYEQIQLLVNEGFIEKSFALYALTESGKTLLEGVVSYKENPSLVEEQIKQINESEQKNVITINYKSHIFEQNLISNLTATFQIDENDSLPIVKVDGPSYSGLLHRENGQHWKKFIGESGRALVRQKKLSKFYVEDSSTGRKYLYIVPKKSK